MRAKDLIATYHVRSPSLERAAEAIAIGQSIGNPNLRSLNENDEMRAKHGAEILSLEPIGSNLAVVKIGYALSNFTPGSLTHLLTTVMGGQMDIDLIESCSLQDLEFPTEYLQDYSGPKKGLQGVRKILGVQSRPLIGGIVKPKTGITPTELADICLEMADGGLDFIKEDEILGDISICPFDRRVEAVLKRLENYDVIYCPTLSSPIEKIGSQLGALASHGGNGFHINFWAGLDLLRYASSLQSNLCVHYQKSGDKVMSTGEYSIDFAVWCKLIRIAGADFTHVGMWGGYMSESSQDLKRRLDALLGATLPFAGVVPSFSCGATPDSVRVLAEKFGSDIMISSGGYLHSHPKGCGYASREFLKAAEAFQSGSPSEFNSHPTL